MLIDIERWMNPEAYDSFRRLDLGVYRVAPTFMSAGKRLLGPGYSSLPKDIAYPKIPSLGGHGGCCDSVAEMLARFSEELQADPRPLIVTVRHVPYTETATFKQMGGYHGTKDTVNGWLNRCPDFNPSGVLAFRVWNIVKLIS